MNWEAGCEKSSGVSGRQLSGAGGLVSVVDDFDAVKY